MKNNTPSLNEIHMNHVDNSYLMAKFLEALQIKGSQGGDLNVTIECDSGKPTSHFLGHDVDFKHTHMIKGDNPDNPDEYRELMDRYAHGRISSLELLETLAPLLPKHKATHPEGMIHEGEYERDMDLFARGKLSKRYLISKYIPDCLETWDKSPEEPTGHSSKSHVAKGNEDISFQAFELLRKYATGKITMVEVYEKLAPNLLPVLKAGPYGYTSYNPISKDEHKQPVTGVVTSPSSDYRLVCKPAGDGTYPSPPVLQRRMQVEHGHSDKEIWEDVPVVYLEPEVFS